MKPSYEDPKRNVPEFERVFDDEGVDWAVIGGLAAIERRAERRETVDADFVIAEMCGVGERLNRLNLRKYRVLTERNGTPYLIQGETADGMHFDIYIASIDFEEAVLATKDSEHLASAEAIILYKLMAMRLQDVDDVESILRAHPDLEGLDLEFLEHWASELGVEELWHQFADQGRAREITLPSNRHSRP